MVLNHVAATFGATDNVAANDMRHIKLQLCFVCFDRRDIWNIKNGKEMHQWPMVPDHDTEYEDNPSSHLGGICKDGLTD